MVNDVDTPLGKSVDYPQVYSPGLLYAIPRAAARVALGLAGSSSEVLPFKGEDLWTAYEISWCNQAGKPLVAIGEFSFPCSSPFIIESKSLKLYLNSLNQHRFSSREAACLTIAGDLSGIAGLPVSVQLFSVDDYARKGLTVFDGQCLDGLDLDCTAYQPDAGLLCLEAEGGVAEETVYSHLMKSNCPVTGQPDWASLYLRYRGRAICHESLVRYIVSFREHQDFHENCVERIFTDVMARCRPEQLLVSARYTRRGGLDINPLRTLGDETVAWVRTARQ